MKKILPIAAAVLLATSLTACSGADTGDKASTSAVQTEAAASTSAPAAEPVSLDGTWTQVDSDGDSYQEATIKGDAIEINWVSDGGKTESLYWAGTVDAPTGSGVHEWASKNDTEKTSMSLMASPDETKDFKVDNGVLSYKVSAMGTTTTVELKKK